MCVDSDDYLTDDAVSKVLTWIAAVREDNSIGVISGSRFDTIRKTALSVPAILKENPGLKCLNYERADIGLQKDRAEIVRTELLRVHPFPEYQGENFCTEGVVWNAIALDKKSYGGRYTVFYPDVIYMGTFLPDGLTKQGANSIQGFQANFNGFLDFVRIELECCGVCAKIYPHLVIMLEIAKRKRIPVSELCDRTGLQIAQIKKIKRNRLHFLCFWVCGKLKYFFENKLNCLESA